MSATRQSFLIGLYYYQPYMSGLSEYARRLAEGLVRAGFEVTVVCTRHEPDLPADEWIDGVHVIRTPVLVRYGKGVISPAFWLRIIRLARRHDIVNLQLPLPDAGIVAPFVPARKILVTYHCDINLGNRWPDRLLESISFRLMHIAIKRAAAIVGNSDAYFRNCRFADYEAKYRTIYPPIDTRLYQSDAGAGVGADAECEAGESAAGKNAPFKIGFVGRIVYEKGLKYLFEAIPQLQETIGDIRVLLVGESDQVAGGSVMDELKPYLVAHPGVIHFLGRIDMDELVRFYNDIDVLVLPSIDPLEAFGMVQVEAMCCGTPVVASDLPGVNEVVGKTGFGRIAQPRDSADLARQIQLVAKGQIDPAGFIPEQWDTARTVAGYVQLMNELTGVAGVTT